jgi:Uma2 family endonuclease
MANAVEIPPVPLRGAPLWSLTVTAYHALGEAGLLPKNTELLYGLVYTKPSKTPLHTFLAVRLLRLLESAIPPNHTLRSEQPITCLDSEPEPDVSVVRGTDSDFLTEHPRTAELVIEVCVTSRDYDRSKLRAYALAGVKECWFILGPQKQIEVYRQLKDGQFAEHNVHGPTGALTSAALPKFTLSLEALFPQSA